MIIEQRDFSMSEKMKTQPWRTDGYPNINFIRRPSKKVTSDLSENHQPGWKKAGRAGLAFGIGIGAALGVQYMMDNSSGADTGTHYTGGFDGQAGIGHADNYLSDSHAANSSHDSVIRPLENDHSSI